MLSDLKVVNQMTYLAYKVVICQFGNKQPPVSESRVDETAKSVICCSINNNNNKNYIN